MDCRCVEVALKKRNKKTNKQTQNITAMQEMSMTIVVRMAVTKLLEYAQTEKSRERVEVEEE